ncbi:MAG: Uma2 family endonuclease [Bacteroidota bacterium]
MEHAARILPNYAYEDYIQWKGQWEIIDGISIAKAPIPIPRHQNVVGNLHTVIQIELKKKKCSCKVYQPIDLKIKENTIVNPDVLISCQPIEKKYLDYPPIFVAEV